MLVWLAKSCLYQDLCFFTHVTASMMYIFTIDLSLEESLKHSNFLLEFGASFPLKHWIISIVLHGGKKLEFILITL